MEGKIAFLDIEWNTHPSRRANLNKIVEMGVTVTKDKEQITSYFGLVRHGKGISHNTFNILHLNPNMLLDEGQEESAVVCKIYGLISDCEILVLWSYCTYEILKCALHRSGLFLNDMSVVILQNKISKAIHSKGQISFENALGIFSVEYNAQNLHNALYDAGRLYELYDSFISGLEPDIDAGMKKYKTIKDERRELFGLRGKAVGIKEAVAILDYFGCDYEIHGRKIRVMTDYSNWEVCLDEGMVSMLKHENYRRTNDMRKGYHKQNVKCKDVLSVIEYIVRHDITPHKKSKEMENKQKEAIRAKRKAMQKQRRLYAREDNIDRNGQYWDINY